MKNNYKIEITTEKSLFSIGENGDNMAEIIGEFQFKRNKIIMSE